MKVKELIKKLSKLDQDKNIYVFYDMYAPNTPNIVRAKEDIEAPCGTIKKDEYYIEAW